MKTEVERIRQLLSNSWHGPMWHGANMAQVLAGISAEKAFQKPSSGGHNIYELVMHMHCWRNFVIIHLQGNAAFTVEINSHIDWSVEYVANEEEWSKALQLLAQSQDDLLKAFENFDGTLLDKSMHGRDFSWYDFIHGLIHHDIYHSAQIAILKK